MIMKGFILRSCLQMVISLSIILILIYTWFETFDSYLLKLQNIYIYIYILALKALKKWCRIQFKVKYIVIASVCIESSFELGNVTSYFFFFMVSCFFDSLNNIHCYWLMVMTAHFVLT